MILKKIKIHNFFTFKEAEVELGQKTFFITGENLDEASSDSNGSGKSLFCQSIVWCLFDDLLRKGTKKDDVIGSNSHYTSVILDLEKDSKKIRIERYRNHDVYSNSVKLFVDGKDISNHKDVDKQIESILEVNNSVIYHCAYSDKRKEPLVALTPKQLQTAVTDILDIRRLEKYIAASRSKARDAFVETKTTETLALQLNEQLEKAKKLHDNMLEEAKNRQKNREAQLMELEEKYMFDVSETQEKIDKSKRTISEIKEELKPLLELFEELRLEKEQLKVVRERVKKGSDIIWKSKTQIGSLQRESEKIEKILNSDTCYVCGGKLSDPSILEEHKQEKEQIDDIIAEKLTKLETQQEKLDELNAILESKKDLEQNFNELSKTITEYTNNIEFLRQDVKSAEKESIKMTEFYHKTKNSIESFDSTFTEESENMVNELEEKLSAAELEHSNSLEMSENWKVVGKLIEEMKISIFNNFIYSLEEKINSNFDEMTDGDFKCILENSNGELNFLFTSPSKNGKNLLFSQFSDGEQARITKAVSMALEEMLDVGFIIDDENLSGVDDAGIKAILDFVLQKNQNKTFFFVGHQRAFKDYFVGYDNLHIIKEKGVSRLVHKIL